jgi:hypothetical protein
MGDYMKEQQKRLLPSKAPGSLIWQRACTSLGLLFLLLLGIIASPILALFSFNANLPIANIARIEDVDIPLYSYDKQALVAVSSGQDPGRAKLQNLLANIPQANSATSLRIPNYQEDRAVREAIFARNGQWQQVPNARTPLYRASNHMQVYFGNPSRLQYSNQASALLTEQSERTIVTARIVLGLWSSRRDDPRYSQNGNVVIRADEVLAWRGVQKHQRTAYAGSTKRFSDGYQEKHKQQVVQDLAILQQYYLRGQHTLVIQGKMTRLPVDSPYLHITALTGITGQAISNGYVIAPGNWIDDYETNQHIFLAEVSRKIFQLNPQNDQLALRMALYLSEQWRQQARSSQYKEPLVMADLLSASMISVDKANLTSRFAPRVEAALQKLYAQGILGAAPVCLTCVDRTQVQWGKDWLAARWSIVPPQ